MDYAEVAAGEVEKEEMKEKEVELDGGRAKDAAEAGGDRGGDRG